MSFLSGAATKKASCDDDKTLRGLGLEIRCCWYDNERIFCDNGELSGRDCPAPVNFVGVCNVVADGDQTF